MVYAVYCRRDTHTVNSETVDLCMAQDPPMEKLQRNVNNTLGLGVGHDLETINP